jgi:hypothetical protein
VRGDPHMSNDPERRMPTYDEDDSNHSTDEGSCLGYPRKTSALGDQDRDLPAQ